MDELDTGKLRALIAKATPGEWFVANGGVGARQVLDNGNVVCLEPENMMAASLDKWPANAAYIATFDPPTTTALLDTIDTLRAQLAEARVVYDELIYAVEMRVPGETRHQTALNCIRHRSSSQQSAGEAQAAYIAKLATEASHD